MKARLVVVSLRKVALCYVEHKKQLCYLRRVVSSFTFAAAASSTHMELEEEESLMRPRQSNNDCCEEEEEVKR